MAENGITARDLMDAAEKSRQDEPEEKTTEWRGLTLTVKRFLPFREVMALVHEGASACFTEDSGEYIPEAGPLAAGCGVLEHYAGLTLPEDISEKYALVCGTDILDAVTECVDKEQFDFIMKAIRAKTDYMKLENLAVEAKHLGELLKRVSDLEESLSGLFSGIDRETVGRLAEALADGKFDEKKLLEAFQTPSEPAAG